MYIQPLLFALKCALVLGQRYENSSSVDGVSERLGLSPTVSMRPETKSFRDLPPSRGLPLGWCRPQRKNALPLSLVETARLWFLCHHQRHDPCPTCRSSRGRNEPRSERPRVKDVQCSVDDFVAIASPRWVDGKS